MDTSSSDIIITTEVSSSASEVPIYNQSVDNKKYNCCFYILCSLMTIVAFLLSVTIIGLTVNAIMFAGKRPTEQSIYKLIRYDEDIDDYSVNMMMFDNKLSDVEINMFNDESSILYEVIDDEREMNGYVCKGTCRCDDEKRRSSMIGLAVFGFAFAVVLITTSLVTTVTQLEIEINNKLQAWCDRKCKEDGANGGYLFDMEYTEIDDKLWEYECYGTCTDSVMEYPIGCKIEANHIIVARDSCSTVILQKCMNMGKKYKLKSHDIYCSEVY